MRGFRPGPVRLARNPVTEESVIHTVLDDVGAHPRVRLLPKLLVLRGRAGRLHFTQVSTYFTFAECRGVRDAQHFVITKKILLVHHLLNRTRELCRNRGNYATTRKQWTGNDE